MPLSSKEIGQRLKAARSNAGMTQDAVSEVLGLARTTLVAIEQGERKVSANEIEQLSELYRIAPSDIVRPSAVHSDLAPKFRAASANSDDAVRRATETLASFARINAELEAILNQGTKLKYTEEHRLMQGDLRAQAEDAAMEVRQWLGIAYAPIQNLLELLQSRIGVKVFLAKLDSKISGLFAEDAALGACMLVNESHPFVRQEWTAAHEFGHCVVMRHNADVLLEDELRGREERFADCFAASLKLPQQGIRRRYRELVESNGKFRVSDLSVLAAEYRVSHQALCRRMEELGLLKRDTWAYLRERGYSAKDYDSADPPPTFVPRFWMLAAAAVSRGMFSEGQLVEGLRMERIHVRTWLDQASYSDVGELALPVGKIA